MKNKIVIVGTGYVGLVTGTCFAEMGNQVVCVDIDTTKIENLKKGIIPIFEPGLENLVSNNYKNENLNFTTNLKEVMPEASILFIAVGTPMGEDGSADLQYVLSVAKEVGQLMQHSLIIVDKSTVPVGTADKVKDTIQKELDKRGVAIPFEVVSNPEFLKEGDAIND
ncbi:MAG TPA: UDP-glucose/GDP-mannose dehydrogenase family protein, partial [Flavobacteriia bacterium]|nr:UDP-glucose/GDP-mannose dehydrogenase family protein [Flavobacteriia bacterium]